MPVQKVDEQHIIQESLKLFQQNSYHNTSMAQIAEACGILKGSLYHYFKSKEELMKKVMTVVHRFFAEEVFVHAYNNTLNAQQRLEAVISASRRAFYDKENGQILGNIGFETAIAIPEFNEIIQSFFQDFFDAMQTIYALQYPKEQAESLAERTVAEVEGSIMMSRIFADKRYLENTFERLMARVSDVEIEEAESRK